MILEFLGQFFIFSFFYFLFIVFLFFSLSFFFSFSFLFFGLGLQSLLHHIKRGRGFWPLFSLSAFNDKEGCVVWACGDGDEEDHGSDVGVGVAGKREGINVEFGEGNKDRRAAGAVIGRGVAEGMLEHGEGVVMGPSGGEAVPAEGEEADGATSVSSS